MKIKNVVFALALGAIFMACEKDDDPTLVPLGAYGNGILVSNEGPFNNGTGTVSFVSGDLTETESAIFNTVNNANLGNVVQSIGFADDYAYIIANVSNTITVVDRYTFERVTVITEGLNNPRYFLYANGKGYVTNWGDPNDVTDDFVAIIDLSSNKVSSSIPTDFGPEKLVLSNTSIYVAHQGAYGQNNVISVIDANSDEVTTTIPVVYVPNSMQIDSEGYLWVLSGGKPAYTQDETAGGLTKINTANNSVDISLDFETDEHPGYLGLDGSKLYYILNGELYSMATSAATLPLESEI
ncbi:MAG: YncE family protein, partial [Maribacter sp.]|nr:YncE family protein [Maribacter sp.]